INLQAVDIFSITNLVLKLSEPLIKNKKLKLINEIPENTPAVLADENRLQQILYNVIGNAIKFTEEGTVTVQVGSVAVGTGLRPVPTTDMLQIIISDTGIGIPENKL